MFCLLALRNARDWRRGEDIRLQELQDHHIFPQAYLKRHGLVKRVDVNTIANRTLISNETNGKIKAKAPAQYLTDADIFPSGARNDLLGPHFVDEAIRPVLLEASEDLSDPDVADLYDRFLKSREEAIIGEIRRVCGITKVHEDTAQETPPDEEAEDIKSGNGSWEEVEVEELEMDLA